MTLELGWGGGGGGAGGALAFTVIRAPRRRLLIAGSSQAVSQQRLPVSASTLADGRGGSDSILIMLVSVRGRISLGFLLFFSGGGGVMQTQEMRFVQRGFMCRVLFFSDLAATQADEGRIHVQTLAFIKRPSVPRLCRSSTGTPT